MTLPCIVCEKDLENAGIGEFNQPYAGTTFKTYGHYGSTVFDPMDGSYLVINVCDACLVEKAKIVWHSKEVKPAPITQFSLSWEKSRELADTGPQLVTNSGLWVPEENT